MLTKSKFVGLAAVATLWAGPALAVDYTLNLSLILGNVCTLSATSGNVALTVPPADTGFFTGSATFTATCTNLLPYNIKVGGGQNLSLGGDTTTRKLKSAATGTAVYIPYKLYNATTATAQQEWPVATDVKFTGDGKAKPHLFYFKSTGAKSTVTATGVFNDVVVVAVTF
jgi:hypothetical protein